MSVLTMTKQDCLSVVRYVLSSDFCCEPEQWLQEGIVYCRKKEMPGRRNFPYRPHSFSLTTMGASVIVTGEAEHLEALKERIAGQSREEVFSLATLREIADYAASRGQTLAGPDHKYVCFPESLRIGPKPPHIWLDYYEGRQILELYQYAGFVNALRYRINADRPDIVAVVAWNGERIVGIAGASEDYEQMLQVGVDVAADCRGQGIGSYLVGKVTERILEMNKIPYYSTSASHFASRSLATSVGYRPVWLEVCSK